MSGESPVEAAIARRLGEYLRAQRAQRRLTQEQVALAANINRNHYQLLESGLNNRTTKAPANPTIFTLVALSRVFDVTPEEMLRYALQADSQSAETQPVAK